MDACWCAALIPASHLTRQHEDVDVVVFTSTALRWVRAHRDSSIMHSINDIVADRRYVQACKSLRFIESPSRISFHFIFFCFFWTRTTIDAQDRILRKLTCSHIIYVRSKIGFELRLHPSSSNGRLERWIVLVHVWCLLNHWQLVFLFVFMSRCVDDAFAHYYWCTLLAA